MRRHGGTKWNQARNFFDFAGSPLHLKDFRKLALGTTKRNKAKNQKQLCGKLRVKRNPYILQPWWNQAEPSQEPS